MKIYPNPTQSAFIIEGEVGGNYRLSDVTGRIVKEGEINSDKTEVNISDLSTGIYVIGVNGKVAKVIKN